MLRLLQVCSLCSRGRPAQGIAGACTPCSQAGRDAHALHGLLQVGHPQAPELVGAALKALSLW